MGVNSLWLMTALLLGVSAEEVFARSHGMMHELEEVLADLGGKGKTYLGRLAGEQTLISVHKAFSQVLSVLAEGIATCLNVLLQHLEKFLHVSGIQGVSPVKSVTPEGLVFVAQWVIVALIGYWLISYTFRLVASTLRWILWLLQVCAALACFVLILIDHSVGTEVMAVRLAVLLSVCILLGIGTSRSSNLVDKTAHLEKHVKLLERRLGEMENRSRTED